MVIGRRYSHKIAPIPIRLQRSLQSANPDFVAPLRAGGYDSDTETPSWSVFRLPIRRSLSAFQDVRPSRITVIRLTNLCTERHSKESLHADFVWP